MDQEEIINIYKLLKKSYEKSDWDLVEETIDFISEYIEDDEISDELN